MKKTIIKALQMIGICFLVGGITAVVNYLSNTVGLFQQGDISQQLYVPVIMAILFGLGKLLDQLKKYPIDINDILKPF